MDDEAAVAASADLDFSMPDEMLDYEEAGQHEPAAYDGSPPSRSQQPPQLKADNTRPSSKDAAERKARAKISYEVWKAENEKSGQAVDDKDQENRGSRHESAPHREHSHRQEPSRHDQPGPHRETSRHHESPRHRDTARRREASPADHQPRPARTSPDDHRMTEVPRLWADRALGNRRLRTDRAAHRSPQRTRSPAPGQSLSHRPRSPVPFRQVVLPHEQSRSPATHALSVWPELSEVSGLRPRAPLRHSDTAWEADRFDAEPYRPYTPAAPMEHRHRPDDRYGDYREHDRQRPSYRVPADREAGYASAGHAASLNRVPDHRPAPYEYGREPYSEYPGTRSVEVGHNGHVRHQANWDAPRHPDVPPYYAYKDSQPSVDSRWVDVHYDREAPKAERDIPRASASFTRQTSYPEQRYAMEEAHPSSRSHAPRLARELVPLAGSYRDGQDARVDRDGHPLAPRYADEYVVGRAHSRDPWRNAPPPPPLSAARHASPRDRSPRRRDQANRYRYREYEVGVHQDADRPSDRTRRHADRAEPRERAAGNPLAATSKSFAIEAAARNAAPRHADPEHTPSSELPPPPLRPAAAAHEKPSEAPKPSRASVLVMPKPEAETGTKRESERDSSPELNVEQGCLQAPAIPQGPRDRPFQRGRAPQQPGNTSEKSQAAEGRHQTSKEVSGRDTNHHSDRRDRDQSEPRDAHLKTRGSSPGRGRKPNDSKKDSSSRHHDSSHLEAGQASDVKESGMGQSQQKADRKADAAKLKVKDGPAATADSKDKAVKSDDKVSSRARAERAKSSPSAKPKADTVRDSKSHERRPARSPTKAAGGKGSERSGARRELVVAKEAGKKRHSRSPERGRSPKRRASPPDKHTSGKAQSSREAASAAAQDLPPPPALPGSTPTEGYLPPPPTRPDAKRQDQSNGKEGDEAAGDLPDGTDLPPPPPKPKSKVKSTGKEAAEPKQDTSLSSRQHDVGKAQKPSRSAERKAAAKPERQPGSSRRDGGELGKNRAADGHKAHDKSSGGRSGQKRSRTRSPEKSRTANGISRKQSKLSDAQRAKSSPDVQKSGAKASTLRNGKISTASKVLDKDVKKEWIYADKSKQYGPCTMVRLQELKKQLQEDKDPYKVTEFMCCDIWREGDKKNMRLVKDVL